jgi:hypothetical protein
MQPKQDLLRLAKGQEHRTRPRPTRSVPPAHGRTRTDTAGAVSPSARPGPRQMDGSLAARAPVGREIKINPQPRFRARARGAVAPSSRPVPRVVSPCCAVAPSRPRRPVPRARSPSAMHRLAARHRTRARPGASERESRAKRASPCTCPSRPGRYQPDACVDPAAFGYLWPPAAATADLARGLRCGRMEWRVSNFFIRGGG